MRDAAVKKVGLRLYMWLHQLSVSTARHAVCWVLSSAVSWCDLSNRSWLVAGCVEVVFSGSFNWGVRENCVPVFLFNRISEISSSRGEVSLFFFSSDSCVFFIVLQRNAELYHLRPSPNDYPKKSLWLWKAAVACNCQFHYANNLWYIQVKRVKAGCSECEQHLQRSRITSFLMTGLFSHNARINSCWNA